jgi:hypothetical protein
MFLQSDFAAIAASFDFHRASPNVSIDEYVRQRHLELGQTVVSKQRIYLDKCFWIKLRDSHLKGYQDLAISHLLAALLDSVSTGKMVCPLSPALFYELMKQTDPKTRYATAELMDKLSGGLSFISQEARIQVEVSHFFHELAGYVVHPVEAKVWTRVPCVFGIQHPINRHFSPEEQSVMQKAFFDHLFSFSLEQISKKIGNSWPQDSRFAGTACRLNQSNGLHSNVHKSFEATFRSEILSIIDLCSSTAHQVLSKIEAEGHIVAGVDYADGRSIVDFLKTVALERSTASKVRTLYIGACLHAAVRWNRGKKLSANDLLDFEHAEAALAYCDFFLTDGPMRTLLTQKNLGLQEVFPCKVGSTAEEALAWLQ